MDNFSKQLEELSKAIDEYNNETSLLKESVERYSKSYESLLSIITDQMEELRDMTKDINNKFSNQ